MAKNNTLVQARRLKADEFYTQWNTIANELVHYEDLIKNKSIYCDCGAKEQYAVYCSCDHPSYSNFFEYFCRHAVDLNLRWVAATWYDIENPNKKTTWAVKFQYPKDKDPKDYDPDNWKDYLKKFEIPGNGDFRSEACIAIMKSADIICSNPPFSLFREYIAQLIKYNKKFLVLGNQNSSITKEIFSLIKDNKLWYGYTLHSGDVEFKVPNNYENKSKSFRIDENGNQYVRVTGIRWFTNIEHSKRNERMELMKSYTGHEDEYPKYDNYDAIEVNVTKNIPNDYDGVMGVPITWLDKYCPTLFEIIGCDAANIVPNGWKGMTQEFVNLYYAQGNTGSYKVGNRLRHYINKDGKAIIPYNRILIRRRPEDIERFGNR